VTSPPVDAFHSEPDFDTGRRFEIATNGRSEEAANYSPRNTAWRLSRNARTPSA